jgi:hypothetical protein
MLWRSLGRVGYSTHFLAFLVTLFFLISTFSIWLVSRLSDSLLAISALSALKVKRCFPLLILNLVIFLFVLMNTAKINIRNTFLGLRCFLVLGAFSHLKELLEILDLFRLQLIKDVPFCLMFVVKVNIIIKILQY